MIQFPDISGRTGQTNPVNQGAGISVCENQIINTDTNLKTIDFYRIIPCITASTLNTDHEGG